VVEAEGLVHDVGLGLHLHPQQRDGLPPAHPEGDLSRGVVGEGRGFARAMLLPPRSPSSRVLAPLPHLDVLRLPGPALPQGAGGRVGTGAQPCRPLPGARAGCPGVQHGYGCTVLPGQCHPALRSQTQPRGTLPTGDSLKQRPAPTCAATTAGSAEKVWYLKGMRTVSLGRR